MLKLELKNHEEVVRASTTHTRDTYAVGHYKVTCEDSRYPDGFTTRKVYARPVPDLARRERYLPELTYDSSCGPLFTARTTTFGELGEGKFEQFAQAQQEALEVMRFLVKEFLPA